MKLIYLVVLVCSTLLGADNSVKITVFENRVIGHGGEELGTSRHGTAFRIDINCKKGYPFLTAAHNILTDDNKGTFDYIRFELRDKKVMAKLVCLDVKLDIALLVTQEDMDVNKLKLGEDIHLKDKVMFYGAQRDNDLKEFKGEIAEMWEKGLAMHRMKTSSFDHGNSGGPVLKDGMLVGIAVCGYLKKDTQDEVIKDVGLFVPICIIKEFLYNNRKELK